jgi:Ca-activated chloride channel family protein
MLMHGWRIEKLSSLSARQLVTPTTRVNQGRIAVAGELLDSQARIDVTLVHPDGRRRTLALQVNAKPVSGRWPGQQWAQWRSAELAENASLNSGELQRIAAAHGIVGPNSSLIVLELAADYARYSLPAPPELADEVARLSQQQFAQVTQTRQAHIEAMVRQFDEKQRWWDRDFPKEAPKGALSPRPRCKSARVGSSGLGRHGTAARVTRAGQGRTDAGPLIRMPVAPAAAAPSPHLQCPPPRLGARADMDNRSAKSAAAAPSSTIALQAWVPDAPYMKRLQDAGKDELYRVYLDERAAYLSSSSFYMDAAGVFFERGLPELGLRVLSNLAEMNLENRQLLRLYAYRLVQARRNDLAVPVFERISELAPNEPQSWRDLGLALAESGQPQRAVNALWEVVSQPWNGRFAGINMIALAELNAIAAQGGFQRPAGAGPGPGGHTPAPQPAAGPARGDGLGQRRHRHRYVGDRPERRKSQLCQPAELPGRRHEPRRHGRLRPRGVFAQGRQARQVRRGGAVLRPAPAGAVGRHHGDGARDHRFRHAAGARRVDHLAAHARPGDRARGRSGGALMPAHRQDGTMHIKAISLRRVPPA